MLRELYAKASAAAEADEEVTQLVSVDELVVSFKRNCDTPPLNISSESIINKKFPYIYILADNDIPDGCLS